MTSGIRAGRYAVEGEADVVYPRPDAGLGRTFITIGPSVADPTKTRSRDPSWRPSAAHRAVRAVIWVKGPVGRDAPLARKIHENVTAVPCSAL